MKGAKPKPTLLKILEGNPGKRPLNADEPKPQLVTTMKAPRNLGKVARREWARVARELMRMQLLTEVDTTALAAYCQSYERWIQAEAEIAQSGLVVETVTGRRIANPAIAVANRSMELMHRFLVEFGMTPSARTRIRVSKAEEASGGLLNGEWAGGAKKSTGRAS